MTGYTRWQDGAASRRRRAGPERQGGRTGTVREGSTATSASCSTACCGSSKGARLYPRMRMTTSTTPEFAATAPGVAGKPDV